SRSGAIGEDRRQELSLPCARSGGLLSHGACGARGCGVSRQALRAQASGLDAGRVLLLDILLPRGRGLSGLVCVTEVLVGVAYCCAFLFSHVGLSLCPPSSYARQVLSQSSANSVTPKRRSLAF